jgi:hypothetical protein
MSKQNKEILYPKFLECTQYTPDAFWENIFVDLAYGKTPYGSFITNEILCCCYKDKKFSYNFGYKFSCRSSQEVTIELTKILTAKLGIMSKQERLANLNRLRVNTDSVKDNTTSKRVNWSSIRKQTLKELLIDLYAIRMKKKHKMTLDQAQYLRSVMLTSSVIDIEYDGERIVDVRGINIVGGTVHLLATEFKRDSVLHPTLPPLSEPKKKKHMADSFENLCSHLRKKSA